MSKLDAFTRAYLECALWSSTDDDGEPLDAVYSIDDLAPETIQSAIEDCDAFRQSAGAMLDAWTDEQAGHDYWLTRNGHGAGFWDRRLPFGDELSALCRHQTVDLYVRDDGLIYST